MSKHTKDLFKIVTKTICHLDFNHVDSQKPCSRSVCECHESYKKQLKLSRERRKNFKNTIVENA